MALLPLRGDGIRIAMSGTPFDSKPFQLWGTLNWLDPKQHSAKHRWIELFWRKGGYTGFEVGEFIKEREPLLWDSLSAIALRRTKAEVAPDLPPKTYVGSPLEPTDETSPVGVWLPMDGQQERAYRAMEALSFADLESGRLEALSALAELTRLKQLACCYGDLVERYKWAPCTMAAMGRKCPQGSHPHKHKERYDKYVPRLPSNKFDWTVNALEEWGYPKNPLTRVVIVSFFTGILEAFGTGIEVHFKRKQPLCTYITGKTPQGHRRRVIDLFNSGSGPDIMLLNVRAGGTAITIDSADRMVFISETRIPDQQTQAEDRIHRVSNPRQCMYYYLRSLDTVDVGTALVNQERDADARRLLDGRRGIEYMRHVMDLSHA
jgi:SNF2 family DNA or RNA helicase